VQSIAQATGLDPRQPLTPELLNDPRVAIPLAKAMSRVEAGREFPLDDQKWAEAHRMALGGSQQAAQPQLAQGQPQLPRTADASQGQGLDRETLARMLANPLTREAAQKLILQRAGAVGQTEYGLNPQYATDAQGNIVPWVPGKDGTPKMIKLPGGAKPFTPGQLQEEKSSGRERGEVMGKMQGNLPAMEYNAKRMIETVDSLTNDPYLGSMLGPLDSRLPNISADSGRVQSKIDQIQGKTFLQAFDSLRGAGQITEAEGNKATQSLNRLQATQVGTQDYYAAAEEFKKDVADLLEVARRKAGGGGAQQAPHPSATHVWNPQTGRLEAVGGR
jgi:hypothetical protein